MAGEEVYIVRFGVWLARALGGTGAFAADLNTDGIGLRIPDIDRCQSRRSGGRRDPCRCQRPGQRRR